jgi:Inner membrane protein CreD
MLARMAAIVFIFLCIAAAWATLGNTVMTRTATQDESLKTAVGELVNQVKNFSLAMRTDFDQIDFPQSSLSPTQKTQSGPGWDLKWQYASLLSGVKIGMVMPRKLNPGPWVSQITFAAPVSLFLFFFVVFVLTTVKRIRLHPMNYFFIGAAFFSFHLLLAYLVDHVSIHVSFLICSLVSIALVVSYLRLAVGNRFAFIEAGVLQFVYLVLFSYTFFFERFTGLAITILCILTLFVVMQFTGRVDWDTLFRRGPTAEAGAIPRA